MAFKRSAVRSRLSPPRKIPTNLDMTGFAGIFTILLYSAKLSKIFLRGPQRGPQKSGEKFCNRVRWFQGTFAVILRHNCSEKGWHPDTFRNEALSTDHIRRTGFVYPVLFGPIRTTGRILPVELRFPFSLPEPPFGILGLRFADEILKQSQRASEQP